MYGQANEKNGGFRILELQMIRPAFLIKVEISFLYNFFLSYYGI